MIDDEEDFTISDEINYRLYSLRRSITKQICAINKRVTYNKNTRDMYWYVVKEVMRDLKHARRYGFDEEALADRNRLIDLNRRLASAVQGHNILKKAGKTTTSYDELGKKKEYPTKYDELEAKVQVKEWLESGADVRALFLPLAEDDNELNMRVISVNCLPHGMRVYPIYFSGEKKKHSKGIQVDPVWFDAEHIYDQTYTIGELATLYCQKPVPDIIAMLICADADFMVRTNDNPNGVHVLVRMLQKDFDITKEDKQNIIDVYKQVYIDKHNKLSAVQRQGIVDVMKSCIDEKNPVSQTILPENKDLIKGALSEMLAGQTQKTIEMEK